MKLLPRILADEDELDQAEEKEKLEARQAPDHAVAAAGPPRRWVLLVACAALVPRLAYLFFFSNPENAGDPFTDAYHHWQIAYLTKEIGLPQGRLWDMRGWEYFWGLLHPALMNVLFFLTGSTDIVMARLLSLAFGSLAVVLIFLLCHRYWGISVAVVATAFAALSPVSVFNDDAGMAEPIAMALLLLGIWLIPRRGFLGGAAWGLAAMARVEAWLFGAGLVVAALFGARGQRRSWAPLIGWLIVMAVYLKFLLDQTGDPVYPLYWNFQYVALGANGTGSSSAPASTMTLLLLGIGILGAAVGLGWSLWKRPPSYLLLTYGFGYWASSLASYQRYATEWKERRFEFPLDFAAILLGVLLLKLLPHLHVRLRAPGWGLSATALLAVQALWLPIQSTYAATEPLFQYETSLGQAIGEVYNQPAYRGGVLAMPGDEPTLLYIMVRDEHVPGDRITSEFYDPFYYLPAGYHYADHKDVAGPLLQCWLANTKTRLLLLPPYSPVDHSVPDYQAFIADHPDWFSQTGAQLGNGWSIVAVQVPTPAPGECAQASRAAPH